MVDQQTDFAMPKASSLAWLKTRSFTRSREVIHFYGSGMRGIPTLIIIGCWKKSQDFCQMQTKDRFNFPAVTLTTEICKPIQNMPAGIQAGGRRWGSITSLGVSFTAYLKIRTASHYMDLHSNTQPIYFNFTLGSSEARLLTVPVISKMWAGGRSFHFMETVCLAMLWN